MKIETAFFTPLTSNELLVCETLEGLPVHVENAPSNLFFGTQTVNHEGVINRSLAALKNLDVSLVQEAVNATEFISRV